MSCDAVSHISTEEKVEQEIRHKETVITGEISHSSQSQVGVQSVKLGVAQDHSVNGADGNRVNSPLSVRSISPARTDIVNMNDAMMQDSKETQTEIMQSQTKIEYTTDDTHQIQSDTINKVITNDGIESQSVETFTNEDIHNSMSYNKTDEMKCEQTEAIKIHGIAQPHHIHVGNITSDLNKVECESIREEDTVNCHPMDKLSEEDLKMTSTNQQFTTTTVSSNKSAVQMESSKTTIETSGTQQNIPDTNICIKEDSQSNKITSTIESDKNIDRPLMNDICVSAGHIPENNEVRQLTPVVIKQKPTNEDAKQNVVQETCMNGFHSSEIKEENLKTQLKEIIKEIDLEVNKEEEGEYALYHTWQPKGEYKIEKTRIEYEEIVPVKVPDVISEEKKKKETEPSKKPKPQAKPQPKPQIIQLEKPKVVERKPSGDSTCSTPIEIPEGIPLLVRMLPKEEGNDEGNKIPLERLFTPASDLNELELKKRKMFSSSSFYRPDHPTIEDQVHLAHKISVSLVDDNNKQSKGQSMYMNRKSKSTKWAHTGQESGYLEGAWQPEEADLLPPKESKEPPPLKLLLNPKGIHDYNSIQDEQYEECATVTHSQYQLSGIGVGKEIATDLQSPTGKGAALFAKRKKRMDKFIIDETNVQKSSVNQRDVTVVAIENGHSSTNTFSGTAPINNTPCNPGSRNLPDLSNILTQPKTSKAKSILSTNKSRTIKRSNTVSFPSLDRGFPHRTPNPATRERRGQIKSWGSQKDTGISLNIAAGGRPQAQKRFSHVEISTTAKYYSPDGRPLDYEKKQKTNTVYTAEVKVEEKAALSPPITLDFNGVGPNHYLDLAMDNQDKRKSFNLAAKGWGTYNNFYTPLYVGTAS